MTDAAAFASQVNVTCTNTTADAIKLNTAIENSTGDRIEIHGTCLLNATVVLLGDRTYEGDSRTGTILRQASGANLPARHLLCDGTGIPLVIELTGANRNEPQLNVTTGNSHQRSLFVGAGVVWHF